ncbi:hypothetical protein YC2023_088541 [Brassica napus]
MQIKQIKYRSSRSSPDHMRQRQIKHSIIINVLNTGLDIDSSKTPIKEFETGLGGGNLQGSLSQRTLGYRLKRSEQSLVATTIKF